MTTYYASDELISSSELVKKFGSYLSQIRDCSVDKLAVLRNNKVEAVLISKDEYEKMAEALKQVQLNELSSSIKQGLADVEAHRTYPIETLWEQLDD